MTDAHPPFRERPPGSRDRPALPARWNPAPRGDLGQEKGPGDHPSPWGNGGAGVTHTPEGTDAQSPQSYPQSYPQRRPPIAPIASTPAATPAGTLPGLSRPGNARQPRRDARSGLHPRKGAPVRVPLLGDARPLDASHHALHPSTGSRAMMTPTDVCLGVTVSHFSPHRAERRPCWHCTHFERMTAGGTAALCSMPDGPRVRAMPSMGCAAWQREPGADDEPDAGPPAADSDRRDDRLIVRGRQGS
jgi:hypothetical protein